LRGKNADECEYRSERNEGTSSGRCAEPAMFEAQGMALPTAARARLVGLAERILGTGGVSAQGGNNIVWD